MSQVITYSRFWMRRDTALNWTNANPVLHAGEIGIEQDPAASPGEARMKIGDGIRTWNDLDYFGEFLGVPNGDYGDITVSASGATWTIDAGAVTLAKLQSIGQFEVLGRASAGSGDVQRLAIGSSLAMDTSFGILHRAALTGDVTAAEGFNATTLATAQPGAHTWAATQTFTVAPVFTDGAGSRSALGLQIGVNVQAWDTQLDSLASLSYTGNALEVVRVNAGETGFELASIPALTDGDKGDIVVSSSGTVWTLDTTIPNPHTWTGVQTVQANLIVDAGTIRIDRTGDATSAQSLLAVDAGQAALLAYQTSTTNRWTIQKTSTAESGSDAGSDLIFVRYNDAGTPTTAATWTRSTGVLNFVNQPTFNAASLAAVNVAYNWTADQTYTSSSSWKVSVASSSFRTYWNSTIGGAASFTQSAGAGIVLTCLTLNTTNKYPPGYMFGSTDADFTTTNPKLLAGIVAFATENFTADTAGGTGLEFFGLRNAPGAAPALDSLGTWTYADGLTATIASASTATTQAISDNSTKVATTAYADRAAYAKRSHTSGTKTIPAGYSWYVVGPFQISAGAIVEVEADAVLEVG